MVRRIGVIGAGFAGISAARVFKEFGYDVVVYEKESDIGGVWSSARRYPGLTTQNPKDTYYLSELRMPKHFPEWPAGKQVQDYMEEYIRIFHLEDVFCMGCEVVNATQDEAGRWALQIDKMAASGNKQRITDTVDYLIVANGIFSQPSVPTYRGAEKFKSAGGKILHTSEFINLDDARGKHVLVIGYGKSSCDVAHAVMEHAASTTVVARNLIWKIPKRLMNVLNFKFLFLTRMGEALFKYIRVEGFEKFLHGPVGRPIRNGLLGSVQSVVASQLKLRKIGLHPETPLETIARSTVSLVTTGFYEAIHEGRLRVAANAEIVELGAGRARLSTGETVPADLIVAGTGWRQAAPFFDAPTTARITDKDGNFRLFRSMVPIGVKNLAFNGYNSSFFSQLNCEIGALWIAEMLRGGLSLPSEDVQNRHVDDRLEWMCARTDGKHSKGTNIIPFSVHHIDELLNDMGINLSGPKKLRQWLAPVDPGDYRHLLKMLKSRPVVRREVRV